MLKYGQIDRKEQKTKFDTAKELKILKGNMEYQSVPQFANRGIKSITAIRKDIQKGIVPGFQVGNRFYINAPQYIAAIEAECLRNAGKGAATHDPA